jgi:hypothetical protein
MLFKVFIKIYYLAVVFFLKVNKLCHYIELKAKFIIVFYIRFIILAAIYT